MDRSTNPWEAEIFAVASQPESQYYDDLDTAYHEALRYYDENVGARLHQGLDTQNTRGLGWGHDAVIQERRQCSA